MSSETAILMAMHAMMYELDPEDRKRVEECASRLRETVVEYGEHGYIAMGLIGAEATAGVRWEKEG